MSPFLCMLAQLAHAGPGGTVLATGIAGLPGRERQAILADHLVDHDVPEHLQHLVPVRWTATDTHGVAHTVRIEVTPDYLAVGTDRDFLRTPLDLPSAIRVARAWEMVLPTTKIVDEVYARASERLAPQPMPPSDWMRSIEAYLVHHDRLAAQGANVPPRGLRAGHKKDLVLTPKLVDQPDRVAIYGWHRSSGHPIQPLSLWHGAGYTDYSHGVRLVSPLVQVDGEPVSFFTLLADEVLWPLIADEGPWSGARALVWPDADPGYPVYRP